MYPLLWEVLGIKRRLTSGKPPVFLSVDLSFVLFCVLFCFVLMLSLCIVLFLSLFLSFFLSCFLSFCTYVCLSDLFCFSCRFVCLSCLLSFFIYFVIYFFCFFLCWRSTFDMWLSETRSLKTWHASNVRPATCKMTDFQACFTMDSRNLQTRLTQIAAVLRA